jgi:hypothetical protein
VDNKLVGIASAGTHDVSWNTQAVANGMHDVQARATDGCQNQGFSETVQVSVRN